MILCLVPRNACLRSEGQILRINKGDFFTCHIISLSLYSSRNKRVCASDDISYGEQKKMIEVEGYLTRRDFIHFLGGLTAATGLASSIGCSIKKKIPPIQGLKAPLKEDQVILAPGLDYKILIKEGDSISPPLKFGTDNDFIQFIQLKDQSYGLWVNHEALTPPLISQRQRQETPSKAQYLMERELLGGSFVGLKKNSDQSWSIDLKHPANHRLSGSTPIPFNQKVTPANQKYALGTFANCSGGLTPWNTILTCEEKYQYYYGELGRDLKPVEIHPQAAMHWNQVQKEDPRNYGWVVEYDPETKLAKKLLGLGRFSHECAKVALSPQGYPVVYSCDDDYDQCLYKFIASKKDSLDEGELYVAHLEKGQWLSLNREKNKALKKHFKSQIEVLTFCREASKLIGGTPLDRPEDIEIDPMTGHVLIAITNNKKRGNYYGSILKIIEPQNNYSSLNFKSQTFFTGHSQSGLCCPDNMVFDAQGNLWVTSDISGRFVGKPPYANFGNNGLFVIPRRGDQAGQAIQMVSAPHDAEFTGPCFSHDYKTLFLSVQHPGQLSPLHGPYTSHWPSGDPTQRPRSAVITIQGPTLALI